MTGSVQEPAPSRWLAPLLLSTTLLLVGTVAVVNVALGALGRDLDFESLSLSWVVNGYLLSYGGALILGGRLVDAVGPRTALIAGLAVFLCGAVIGAIASTAWLLVAARLLQGLGAALASPAVLGALSSAYPAARRGAMISAWTGTTSAGFSLGLVAGGFIEQWLTWRWIFLLSIPVALTLLVGAIWVAPRKARQPQVLDIWGALLLTTGSAAVVLGLVTLPDILGVALIAFVLATILIGCFIWRSRVVARPLIPRVLFSETARLAAFAASGLGGAALTGMLFILTQLFSDNLGLSPVLVGGAFLLFSVPAVFGSMVANAISRRRPGVLTGVLGFGVAAVGMSLLIRLGTATEFDVGVAVGMALVGLGVGTGQFAANQTSLLGVTGEFAGVTSGMLQTSMQLGAAIGVALFVLVEQLLTIGVVFIVATILLIGAAAAIALGGRFRPAIGERAKG